MNNEFHGKGLYETDLSVPGGYVQGRTQLDDEDFKKFRAKKYGSYDIHDREAAPIDINFDEKKPKPKSLIEQDHEEFEAKKKDFAETGMHIADIPNTHIPLAWTMRNVNNENSANNLRAAQGLITYDEADKIYNKHLQEAATKYRVSTDDIKEWEARKHKGFLTGFAETVNDMRDIFVKTAKIKASMIAAGAGFGAGSALIAGQLGPQVATPEEIVTVPGAALAGGISAAKLADETVVPIAVLQDTAVKEAGSFIYDYRKNHPGMTPEQDRKMRIAAVVSGLAKGGVEAGSAELIMPYVGKVALAVPGMEKIMSPALRKAEAGGAKTLEKYLSTAAGKAFLGNTLKLVGIEVGTEEIQEAMTMLAEVSLGEKISKKEMASRATDTAVATVQGAGLLSVIGAHGEIHSRLRNHEQAMDLAAENINKRIDKINATEETNIAPSEKVFTASIEKNVVAEKGVAEISTEALPKAHAEQVVKVKQIEGQLSLFQHQIENANDLGLGEKEVAQLEGQVQTLTQEKEQAVLQMREIGTERAVRQATQETESQIESTVSKIESVSEQLTGIEEKINAVKKEGGDTSILESKKNSVESKLQVLEGQHEDLLTTKTKLETREDLGTVLKGKTTTIPSGTLVNIEQNAKNTIAKNTEEHKIKVNKILEKNAKEKVKALFKEKQNSFVSGYKVGTKEQIKETKDINKQFTRALLSAGIKRSELGHFDTIRKGVVTNADFVAKAKQVDKVIKAIFEARNKEVALRMTDKLRKLSRPAKGGKKPLGKMTAAIQEKVDRLFAFTKKSAFEAGFDIDELRQKANVNPEAVLTKTEKLKILQMQNNEKISRNQDTIETLSDTKQTPKTKWEGLNKEREDLIAPDKESLAQSIKDVKIAEVEQTEENVKIEGGIRENLTKALNMINMGFTFGDLTLNVEKSAFAEKVNNRTRGNYDPNTRFINVKKDGKFSIAHEVGHYFDHLLGDMLGVDGALFSRNRNFTDTNLKNIYNKMSVVLRAEAARTEKHEHFSEMSKSDQEYIKSDVEIFARIFDAMFYKTEKITNELRDWQSILTEGVPASTISSFKSVLNDLAHYKEVGQRVFQLSEENTKLEKENKQAEKNEAWIEKEAIDRQLPVSTVELINELEMSAELKNKTAAEINAFNEYMAELIQEGRDAKKEKQEKKRAEREAKIAEASATLQKLTPEKGIKGNVTKAFIGYMNGVHANWDSLLNAFFGKDIKDKYSIIAKELERDNFVHEEKTTITKKAMGIFGFKHVWQFNEMISKNLGTEETYIQNVEGQNISVKINKMNAIEAYIHNKSELGHARLVGMYGEEQLNRMLSPLNLSVEDRQLGDLLQEEAEKFYPEVNKVFEEERNITMPKESFFFPMNTEGKTKGKDMSFGGMSFMDQDPSFIFSRDKSTSIALKLGNPMTTLWNHIGQVGDYVHLAQTLNEINFVFNDARISKQIEGLYGRPFVSAFKTKLNDMTLEQRSKMAAEPVKKLDGWVSNSLVAKIALKGSIAVKQYINFISYADGMPSHLFIKYQAEFWKNPKKSIQFMMKDKYIRTRFEEGTSGVELAKAIEDSRFARSRTFIDFSSLNIRLGDIGAIVQGGYSKVKYLMNEKNIPEAEAFKMLAKDTAETQAYSSISSVSNLQAWGKSNAFARWVFAFKNSQNQFVRKQYDAIISHSRGEISTRQLAKTIFIFQVINPWLYTSATSLSLLSALVAGDDESREQAWGQVWTDFITASLFGNANALPIAGDVVERVANEAITGEKYKTPTIPFMATLENAGYSLTDLSKTLMSENFTPEDIDWEDVIKPMLEIGEIGTGLPLTTARNMAGGVGDIFTTDNKLQGALRVEGYSKKKAEQFAANNQ